MIQYFGRDIGLPGSWDDPQYQAAALIALAEAAQKTAIPSSSSLQTIPRNAVSARSMAVFCRSRSLIMPLKPSAIR
jgi:hypothetical protein